MESAGKRVTYRKRRKTCNRLNARQIVTSEKRGKIRERLTTAGPLFDSDWLKRLLTTRMYAQGGGFPKYSTYDLLIKQDRNKSNKAMIKP